MKLEKFIKETICNAVTLSAELKDQLLQISEYIRDNVDVFRAGI